MEVMDICFQSLDERRGVGMFHILDVKTSKWCQQDELYALSISLGGFKQDSGLIGKDR